MKEQESIANGVLDDMNNLDDFVDYELLSLILSMGLLPSILILLLFSPLRALHWGDSHTYCKKGIYVYKGMKIKLAFQEYIIDDPFSLVVWHSLILLENSQGESIIF